MDCTVVPFHGLHINPFPWTSWSSLSINYTVVHSHGLRRSLFIYLRRIFLSLSLPSHLSPSDSLQFAMLSHAAEGWRVLCALQSCWGKNTFLTHTLTHAHAHTHTHTRTVAHPPWLGIHHTSTSISPFQSDRVRATDTTRYSGIVRTIVCSSAVHGGLTVLYNARPWLAYTAIFSIKNVPMFNRVKSIEY